MPGTGNIKYFTEKNSANTVVGRVTTPRDPRLAEIMESVVRHLHAAINEVEPSYGEWHAAIEFLTATGKKCDDKRQEWILLSDVLGVSMLVDAINTRRPAGATENTVLGPFHVDDAPVKSMGETISMDGEGEPLYVCGRVLDLDGNPIVGAVIDTWQASHDGFYDSQQPGVQPDNNLRGVFRTAEDGRYFYRAVKPGYYGIPDDGPVGGLLEGLGRNNMRPAHLHYIVSAPGYETVTTHIFVDDDPYLTDDAVFGVKESLIAHFTRHDDPGEAARLGVANPFWKTEKDFVLTRVGPR